MTADTKTPPHDSDAEQAVLGGCMLAGYAIDDCLDRGLRGADFYRPAHETIWNAILEIRDRREPADALTVREHLVKTGDLARVGGAAYLHTLIESTPTAANAGYYARSVVDTATRRALVQAGAKVAQLGYATDGDDTDALVNAAQATVAAVADNRHGNKGETLDDIADAALMSIGATTAAAVPSPWADLNFLIDGFTPAMMYATGARPGVGKTVYALQWALAHAMACQHGGPRVAYFTFEMSAPRLYQRALASVSGVDAKQIRRGQLTDMEESQVYDADGLIRKLPLVIESASGWTAQQVRARVRQLHREHPVGLVVVDHIGLTRAERSRDNRQAELSEAADVLLGVAHEISTAVHVLTQLNRGVTQRSDPRPVPSDIRDTDRIEQNADIVMLLHRDKDAAPDKIGIAVAKNRDGSEGSCLMKFDGARSRIAEPTWQERQAWGSR